MREFTTPAASRRFPLTRTSRKPPASVVAQAMAADAGVTLDKKGQLPRDLAIEWRPVTQVARYPENPRVNAGAVADVRASLEAYGWQQPLVVDADGVIIVGDTRYLAALDMRQTHVPVYVARNLSPARARAYRLADNKTGERAEWHLPRLAFELTALRELGVDLALTGFRPLELQQLMAPDSAIKAEAETATAPPLPKKATTRPGDVIVLGRHRLLCGDATRADHWDLLMDGAKADMLWTDPPYGVTYKDAVDGDGKQRRPDAIQNDDLDGAALAELLRGAFALGAAATRPGGAWYVTAPPGPAFLVFGAALRDLEIWRQTLAWAKDSFVLGRSDYHYRHESILYGWVPGASHYFVDDRTQDSVWEIPRPSVSPEHPTMKPVELVARAIRNSTRKGDRVVDPFAGSGTTIVAAEQEARDAFLMEVDPRYCDVIVARWEKVTGQRAERS